MRRGEERENSVPLAEATGSNLAVSEEEEEQTRKNSAQYYSRAIVGLFPPPACTV